MSTKSLFARFGFIIFALSLISGCQDPILVGGSLLEDEKLNLAIIDDLKLSSKVIEGERIISYLPNFDNRTYLLGQLDDPIFGSVSAELYLKFKLSITKPNFLNEENIRFDSLVLVLQYDTLGTYGNTFGQQSIKMYQLDENINEKDTFYADSKLNYLPNAIASIDKIINPKDSVKIIDHLTGKLVTLAPQLRLRMDNNIGEALLKNLDANKNDTLLNEYFKGIYLTSTPVNNKPFMYGFNFSNAALATTSPINKLIMYYTVNDTIEKTYEYLINTATLNRFVHNRSGSQVESFINNVSLADSLCYLQGIGGVKSVIKFEDLSSLDTVLINKAELELTIADISIPNGTYNIPNQLIATRKNTSGRLVFIEDIAQLISENISFPTVVGGAPFMSTSLKKYNLNITNHIKQAVKNKSFDSDIYLSVLTETENPTRAIFYGAKHSKYPMKLKITYTKI